MPNVMTQAQLRRIYNISGLYADGWIDDDFIEDIAEYIGAINADRTAYDSTYDNNLAIECIARVLARGVEKDRAEELKSLIRRLAANAAVVRTTILPPGGITEEDVENDIHQHNDDVGRHTSDLDPIRAKDAEQDADLAEIHAIIAELAAEAGDIALIRVRYVPVANGGVKSQLSKDGGHNWADVPGLPALGLAGFHQVPNLNNYLRNDQTIPPRLIATTPVDPSLEGAVPQLHLNNGIYSYQLNLFPVHLLANAAPENNFRPSNGSTVIVNPGGGGRWSAFERRNNAWNPFGVIPDQRLHVFAPGVDPVANGALIGANGEYGMSRDADNNILAIYLKNGGVWGLVGMFGQGGGGMGGNFTEAQIKNFARAVVLNTAEEGNTDPWLVTKLLTPGTTANNRVAFSNGTNLEGREVPNWVWQAAVRITGGKLGANWGNNRVLVTTGDVLTWVTYNDLADNLTDRMLVQIADNSDDLEINVGELVLVIPSAARLLPRFNDEQFEVSGGRISLVGGGGQGETISGVDRVLNLQNQSTNRAGNTDSHAFELPALSVGERVEFLALITPTTAGAANGDLGPHWLSVSSAGELTTDAHGHLTGDRDFGRAGTGFDADDTDTQYVDGPAYTAFSSGARTLYLNRTVDGAADAAIRYTFQLFALRYKASAAGGGTTDYDDLENAPFKNGDPRTLAAADTTKLYVSGTGTSRRIWKALIRIGTDAVWTHREFGTEVDVGPGRNWKGYVNNYGDLGIGVNGDVRGVRHDRSTEEYSTAGITPTWIFDEYIWHSTLFTSEAAALAAVAQAYHNDNEAIGIHPGWYNQAAGEDWTDAKYYTVLTWQAATNTTVLWVPYEYELQQDIHRLDARIDHVETDILGGKTLWFGTTAEYDALTDAQKADASRVHFTPRATT